jgi:hypothetical protein
MSQPHTPSFNTNMHPTATRTHRRRRRRRRVVNYICNRYCAALTASNCGTTPGANILCPATCNTCHYCSLKGAGSLLIDPPACRSADLVGLSLNGGCAATLAEGGISDLCFALCGMCPSFQPTAAPTATPSAAPTLAPSASPTANPSAAPSAAPSASPTAFPTMAPTNSIKGELHCGELATGDTRFSAGTLDGVTPHSERPVGGKLPMPGQSSIVRGDCYIMFAGGVFPPQGGQITTVSGDSRVFHPSSMFGMPAACTAGSDCVGALVCPKAPKPGSTEPQQPHGVNSAVFQAGTVLSGPPVVYFPAFSLGFNVLTGAFSVK